MYNINMNLENVFSAKDEVTETIEWLLNGPAWIRFNVLVHILDKDLTSQETDQAYQDMLNDPKINALVEAVMT